LLVSDCEEKKNGQCSMAHFEMEKEKKELYASYINVNKKKKKKKGSLCWTAFSRRV